MNRRSSKVYRVPLARSDFIRSFTTTLKPTLEGFAYSHLTTVMVKEA